MNHFVQRVYIGGRAQIFPQSEFEFQSGNSLSQFFPNDH